MSDLEDKLEHIKTALAELRTTSGDGPATRKQLDSLFRQVHSLKAVAAADGLTGLSRAAHELENVLHALRTGDSTLDNHVLQQMTEALSETLPLPDELLRSLKAEEKHALRQSLNEGAQIFLVQTSFDAADFDQQFQNLKARLNRDGEVISVAPQAENNKINFRILYATRVENLHDLPPNVTVEPIIRGRSGNAWDRIVRGGESTASALNKEIHFDLRGTELSLDDAIADCLLHLVRNAVHHGIESHGTITITATNDQGHLKIQVTDDGRGIDPQTIASGVLFQPGYSTASEVSEISGRGMGLDVVKTTVEARGGSVKIQSEPGRGSTFEITLPYRSA
ncbi:MAG TPA: ATP-binding protein [Pyrinomonadaceae bacterium]|nr:ATP-binding protein [Pyrinomonadaceae bacterium]